MGSAKDASPSRTSANEHQICTLATSCTNGGMTSVLLNLSPLTLRRLSRYVLPFESTSCQCGAGVSGITKSSESTSTDLPSTSWCVTKPLLALAPANGVDLWPNCMPASSTCLQTKSVSPSSVSANAHQRCSFATSGT